MVRRKEILPGFSLSLGYSTFYLSLLVLIPLMALAVKSLQLTPAQFWNTVTDEYVLAACKLSFTASIAAALVNGVFGTIVAWALVRYTFPCRKIFDAIVDLPFALPTAVAGLTFADLMSNVPFLNNDGRDWWRITIMLTFVGLPYVVRSIQPVLQDWDVEIEQAAMTLGARPITTFIRIIVPQIFPAWISGVALSFARSVGEYGSVVFISGNIPGKSQIAPQQIIQKLDDYRYAEATAIGLVLLVASLLILLFLNTLDWWSRKSIR